MLEQWSSPRLRVYTAPTAQDTVSTHSRYKEFALTQEYYFLKSETMNQELASSKKYELSMQEGQDCENGGHSLQDKNLLVETVFYTDRSEIHDQLTKQSS